MPYIFQIGNEKAELISSIITAIGVKSGADLGKFVSTSEYDATNKITTDTPMVKVYTCWKSTISGGASAINDEYEKILEQRSKGYNNLSLDDVKEILNLLRTQYSLTSVSHSLYDWPESNFELFEKPKTGGEAPRSSHNEEKTNESGNTSSTTHVSAPVSF